MSAFEIIILIIVFGALVLFWYSKRASKSISDKDSSLEKINSVFDSKFGLFAQQLNDINQRIDSRLAEVGMRLDSRLKENKDSLDKSSQATGSNILSVSKEIVRLTQSLESIDKKVKEVSSFQEMFRAPKLRGRWGELHLEHILGQYYPKDMFEMQHYFKNKEAVDAVLKLPNGRLLPIDEKFPREDFERMINEEDEGKKVEFRKSFVDAIKREISDIAQKYILPAEGTTDVALLFLPAETIFYELINNVRDSDLAEFAMKKRVILTSPNTFYLTVQSISHWARDVRISEETKNVLKRLQRIKTDADKLVDEFNKLGKHLQNAVSSFDDSQKRVELLGDRVGNLLEKDELKEVVEIKAIEE
jgi:DNA recombination protein RmuC